jgi:hypothetical protein
MAAALFYGREIGSLRNQFEAQLFDNMTKDTAMYLAVAQANREFSSIKRRAEDQAQKESRAGRTQLDVIAQAPIQGAIEGNQSPPDAAMDTLVDTVPHVLERVNRLPNASATESVLFHERGPLIYSVLSIEHGLRGLWQQTLWEGWILTTEASGLHHRHVDRSLATLWCAWLWRQVSLMSQAPLLDAFDNKARSEAGEIVEPFLRTTVVGIGGRAGKARRFRYGTLSGQAPGQRRHLSEATVLEEAYVSPFLDTPLPIFGPSALISCRDLQNLWCVLRDAADILYSRCGKAKWSDILAVQQHALKIEKSELQCALSRCSGLSMPTVEAAIKFFTCDPSETAAMFAKGLWSNPLLLVDEGRYVVVLLAPIVIGSPVRRIELWLERGGLSDQLPVARRGKRYEDWVRTEIRDAISTNALLPNARCAGHALASDQDCGEEIDLLIRLGSTLIVGEIKCLLGPSESIERFNYLRKLDEAGLQAYRKAQWASLNLDRVAKALDIPAEEATNLHPRSLVIVNQGLGHSYIANATPVVDFHSLWLYLGQGTIVTGSAIRPFARDAAFQEEILYRSELEAETRFESWMTNPPTLKRFIGAAVWETSKFLYSGGRTLSIEYCALRQDVLSSSDVNQLNAMLGIENQ